MAYFDCQIVQGGGGIILTVDCSSEFAGAAITATDGVTTLSQTCPSSSPYEVQFHIPNVGTWTISGTVSGQTYTTQVIVPSSAVLHIIPNGSTATPTDDIQTWLHCADIWDKNYTTISQVIADSTTLLALISSNNAIDYMVRSTSWASAVCADSTAMTYIGANNYCADTLLADSTWKTSICNSTYFESVLNVKVPTMTSDTTPSGVASASSVYDANMSAYKAFDGNTATSWQSNSSYSIARINYKFANSVKIFKVTILPKMTSSGHTQVSNFKIGGTNTDGTWTDLSDVLTCQDSNTVQSFLPSKNLGNYTYYSIYITSGMGSYYYGIAELQFYGRKNV